MTEATRVHWNKGRPWGNGLIKGLTPWNKGLTKKTSASMRQISKKMRRYKNSLGKHWSHTQETRAKMSQAHKGMSNSEETRQKLAIIAAERRAKGNIGQITSLEHALSLLLQSAGLEFEAQKQFGKYVADAWIPNYQLVFEADGRYWHSLRNAASQQRRDAAIIDMGAVAVVHLDDDDLEGWLPV